MKKQYIFLAFVLTTQLSCSLWNQNNELRSDGYATDIPVYTHELAESVNKLIPSAINVVTFLSYDIEHFLHERRADGSFIRDDNSVTGYKLIGEKIIKEENEIKSFGGGLIIGTSDTELLILTSRHIVIHKEEVTNYYFHNGKQTDVPRSRATLRHTESAVRPRFSTNIRPVRILADDPRADLALLVTRNDRRLGVKYEGRVAQDIYPIWGKLGVIVGYPDEVLQVSMGITGAAPYPGNFSIDITGTFGFSGGPVFLLDRKGGLAFAGIGKSVPGKTTFFVAPDSSMQFSTKLFPEDISSLEIRELPVLSQNRMYSVDVNYVINFLRENYPIIDRSEFRLGKGFMEQINK